MLFLTFCVQTGCQLENMHTALHSRQSCSYGGNRLEIYYACPALGTIVLLPLQQMHQVCLPSGFHSDFAAGNKFGIAVSHTSSFKKYIYPYQACR